jgi:uncharacterized protein YbaA (DUF1428 family)
MQLARTLSAAAAPALVGNLPVDRHRSRAKAELQRDPTKRRNAMSYVDGFVVPVPKAKLEDYKKLARTASEIWREHGALEYREWIADDVKPGKLTSFPQSVDLADDETVVFAWIVYESRAHRNAVNDKVMKDPRMKTDPSNWPFDGKRMIFGGFAPLLEE